MSSDYDAGYESGSHAAMEHVKPEIDALKARVAELESKIIMWHAGLDVRTGNAPPPGAK